MSISELNIDLQGMRKHGDEPHLLRDLYRTSQALFNNLSRIVGISASKLALLRLLAIDLPQGAGTMELARRLGVNAAAVSRLIKEMEEQKWFRCRPDPSDRRRSQVSLSAKGQRLFLQIHERVHEFESSMQQKLTPQDIETAIKVLSEIRDTVEQFK